MFCSLYKWLLDCRVDDGRQLTGLISRHVHNCDRCRVYYRQQTEIIRRLRAGRPFAPSGASTEKQAVIEAVRRAAQPANSPVHRPPLILLNVRLIALAAILAIVAAGFWLTIPSRQTLPQVSPQPLPSVPEFSEKLQSSLLYSEVKNRSSLENEWSSLTRDILATADFLLSYTDRIPGAYLPPDQSPWPE